MYHTKKELELLEATKMSFYKLQGTLTDPMSDEARGYQEEVMQDMTDEMHEVTLNAERDLNREIQNTHTVVPDKPRQSTLEMGYIATHTTFEFLGQRKGLQLLTGLNRRGRVQALMKARATKERGFGHFGVN